MIKQFMSRVEEKYSDAQLGIHKIATDSVTWRSVVEKDSFFEDVFVTTDIEKFVRLIAEDQELKAYDVAKFILSTVQVSHLKLQKLLYYVYADFLLATGKKLFKEPICSI
ncbi:hypothetical protein P7H06_15540 [Paenibacillus larvae]|nr:hypothetical protein [Paenibacillus larvae]MDT2260634.1 hypothetical protein [Paenibacillus larvae]